MSNEPSKEIVWASVREGDGQIAQQGSERCGCGAISPEIVAALKPGEIVVDLGSGGGFDVFIAGRKVGATGRAIGVDITPDMLAKARKNTAQYRQSTGLDNVEFRLGEIEHLPVADAVADVVISNCVINLSPDKPQIWREIARVLKPGGRAAVSDLALLRPLPPAVKEMAEALVGCVAGAIMMSETERMAKEAGLDEVTLTPKAGYVESLADGQDPLKIIASLPAGDKPSDYIVSLEITARKPGAICEIPEKSRYTPLAAQLASIAASVAANCEFCLTYHIEQARRLGATQAEMAAAVKTGRSVKEKPARAILKLAGRQLQQEF